MTDHNAESDQRDGDAADAPGFEASLRAAEKAVAALESGRLDLDEALRTYEEGAAHLRRCQDLLDAAEQKVKILTGLDPEGAPCLEPFEAED